MICFIEFNRLSVIYSAFYCIMSYYILFLILFVSSITISTSSTSSSSTTSLLSYLQQEAHALTKSQEHIANFLRSKKIPIGSEPLSLQINNINKLKTIPIILSTEKNPIDCRISLSHVTSGKVCIAPCACTGSQKWIQYSTYNKLRRIDPNQWKVCRTCQTKFHTEIFSQVSTINTSLLTLILDNFSIIRINGLIILTLISYFTSLHHYLLKFLVSRAFWMQV